MRHSPSQTGSGGGNRQPTDKEGDLKDKTMQYEPAARIILHRPDEWKEIVKWLRKQATYIVKHKGNFEEYAQLILQLPVKTKEQTNGKG